MRSIKVSMCAAGLALVAASATAQDGGGQSAAEVAKKLNDPNTALSSLQFKFRYFQYKGDLPDASDQDSFDIEFQPILPFTPFSFSTEDVTYKMIFRPAFFIKFNDPVLDAGGWDDSDFGLGDLSFDLDFAASYPKTGWLWAAGANGSLPTGTSEELTNARWKLGPEFVVGHISEKVTIASIFAHQFDLGGWRGDSVDVSEINPIFAYLPGGGWSINSSSVLTYNHDSDEWTVPINFGVFKTVKMGNTPVKLGAEINYFVQQPDAFGPDWQISFNVTPVIANPFANLLSW